LFLLVEACHRSCTIAVKGQGTIDVILFSHTSCHKTRNRVSKLLAFGMDERNACRNIDGSKSGNSSINYTEKVKSNSKPLNDSENGGILSGKSRHEGKRKSRDMSLQTTAGENKNIDALSSSILYKVQVSEVGLKPFGSDQFDVSCSSSSSSVLNNAGSSILEEVGLQDGQVASDKMKNKRYSSRIISLFKNVKHRREQQFDNTDYDARSEVSRKSKSSVRSSISTKSSQLKGYLKSFSNRNAGKYAPQRRNPGQLNRQDGDDFSDPAASLLVSVDKSPSYSSPSDGSNISQLMNHQVSARVFKLKKAVSVAWTRLLCIDQTQINHLLAICAEEVLVIWTSARKNLSKSMTSAQWRKV
ncbi:hypothetical protein ACHAXS_007866, partial [Conticribra weissflogii]